MTGPYSVVCGVAVCCPTTGSGGGWLLVRFCRRRVRDAHGDWDVVWQL